MDYGKALRIARAIAGLQQKKLAELAGIDASHVSLIEMGKRKPSLATLEKIARALGMPEPLLTLLAAEAGDIKGEEPVELQQIGELLAEVLLHRATKSRFHADLPLFARKT